MAQRMIKVLQYLCERCDHKWIPRTKINNDPTICPRCKSPYWNKPRMIKNGLQAR